MLLVVLVPVLQSCASHSVLQSFAFCLMPPSVESIEHRATADICWVCSAAITGVDHVGCICSVVRSLSESSGPRSSGTRVCLVPARSSSASSAGTEAVAASRYCAAFLVSVSVVVFALTSVAKTGNLRDGLSPSGRFV